MCPIWLPWSSWSHCSLGPSLHPCLLFCLLQANLHFSWTKQLNWKEISNGGVSDISHWIGIFPPEEYECVLACALCCLHSWELLAPLGFDSQGSYKMPSSLAVSLCKNKNGFARPWSSCGLSLVTASFPGASALGSPNAVPRRDLHSVSSRRPQLPQLPQLPVLWGPRRLPTLRIFFQMPPLCLHPSNLVGPPLWVPYLGFCGGQRADLPVILSPLWSTLHTGSRGSSKSTNQMSGSP